MPLIRSFFAIPAVAALALLAACEPVAPRIHEGEIVDLGAVAHGADGFVAAGARIQVRDDFVLVGADSAVIRHSADGSAWTAAELAVPGTFSDVAYGDGVWIAVGIRQNAADPGFVFRSTDGLSWTEVTAPELGWRSVTHENGLFLAIGYDPGAAREVVATSTTGEVWEAQVQTGLFSPRLLGGSGLFLLWGEAGWIAASPEGKEWDVSELQPLNRVSAVSHREGEWVGFGVYDCCFGERPDLIRFYRIRSVTGRDWTIEEVGDRVFVFAVARDADTWVAVTDRGLVRSAAPGGWAAALVNADRTRPVMDVVRGGGRFVAVGRGTAWWSEDGVAWTEVRLDEDA